MAIVKRYDARMTVNLESDKKKRLQSIAEERNISDSMLLLTIVDEWFERNEDHRENNGTRPVASEAN